MNKYNNRPILGVRLHHNNVFIDKVNVAMDANLTTPLKTNQGEKLVNIEIEGSFLKVSLANPKKAKSAALIPLTNVMFIDLGPEETK